MLCSYSHIAHTLLIYGKFFLMNRAAYVFLGVTQYYNYNS